MNPLKSVLKYALLATTLTPLIVIDFLPFPFNFSKFLTFNVLVEFAALMFAGSWLFGGGKFEVKKVFQKFIRNPLVMALGLFFVSAVVSTFTAHNVFKAFWSTVERGDGLFGLFHVLAFFVMLTLTFQKEEDWQLFFKVSLVGGAVMVFYGWLQFLGVTNFPFAFWASARPGSFFENTAYLGSYLIFITGIALLTFLRAKKGGFWRIFSLILAAFSVMTIFLANARGPIIGLFLGGVFLFWIFDFRSKSGRLKGVARKVLIGLVVLTTVFVLTRGFGFWSVIPGFNRLAMLSSSDLSFKTRSIALGSSFKAFFERPIFGWGLENYSVAYNKHYNPDYALYEEAWFDRAHNRLADVGVMQGILGLLSYLAIFVLFFYFVLFSKKISLDDKDDINLPFGRTSAVLAALIIAYFVNNLFLFDTPASYLFFSAVLGFVLYKIGITKGVNTEVKPSPGPAKTLVSGLIFMVVLLGIGYVFYNFSYVPFRQAGIYRQDERSGDGLKIIKDAPEFLEPYNYMQTALRFQFLQFVSRDDQLRKREFDPLTQKAIQAVEDLVERERGYEPRSYIILAGAYTEKGKDNPDFFKKAEVNLREALRLAPKRQDIYYLLAYALAGQNRFPEAISLTREAVALSPRVAKAHYNLGLELALGGQENWDEAEIEFAHALDIGFINKALLKLDYENMDIIYKQMLSVYVSARDKTRVVRIAERLKQISEDPIIKSDLDSVIKLAERNDWEVLIKLLIEPIDQ